MSGRSITPIYPFPSELVSAESKSDPKKYGLPLAQAIFYNNRTNGPELFYNNRENYRLWTNYALGRQSEDQYRPVVGVNPRDASKEWLKGMRWRIKNYMTKRINVAITKMTSRQYDCLATATDPNSVDSRKEYISKIKTFSEHQQILMQLGQILGTNFGPEGIDPDQIPQNDDEYRVHMQLNYKDRAAMLIEKGILSHIEHNNWKNMRPQVAFDTVVRGIGAYLCQMGLDYRVLLRRLDPGKIIMPANDVPNFDDMKYWGFVDEYSIGEAKKLDRKNELSNDDWKRIYDKYKIENQSVYYGSDTTVDYKDVGKIEIMYFEQLTVDTHVWQIKKDKFGNDRMYEEESTYYRGSDGENKFKEKYGDDRKLLKKDIECVYGGYWIVGSKYVFGYEKLKNQSHNKVDGKFGRKFLSIIPFAPNMYSGSVMSLVEQAVPILDDLQTYNLKIQAVVGASVPKGIQVDLSALRSAKFSWDDKELSDQEKILMYMQTGVIVTDSGNKYRPGSSYKPITELENGMADDIMKYMSLIQQALMELDEVLGINKVTAASNLPERQGKKVAEIQGQASETALDYLYKADQYLYEELCKRIYPLHIQCLKHYPEKYYDVFGEDNVKWLLKELRGGEKEFSLHIEARPTELEWNEFFQDVNLAYTNGQITLGDKVTLQSMNRNLREAREYLKVAERRKIKSEREYEIQKTKLSEESKMAVAQSDKEKELGREESKERQIQLQGEQDRLTERDKHTYKLAEIEKEKELEQENKLEENEQKVVHEALKQDLTPDKKAS